MVSILIKNGMIWDGVSDVPFHGSVLVDGGKILATGSYEDLREHSLASVSEVIDAAGGSVIPALTDSHLHLAAHARHRLGVDLSGTGSLEEAVGLLKDAASRGSSDEWIYGILLNENNWSDARLPERVDLDCIANPVLLMRACCHIHVANKRALELAGFEVFDDLDGALRDDSGELTGILEEKSALPVIECFEKSLIGNDNLENIFEDIFREYLEFGVAEVHSVGAAGFGLGEDLSLYQRLRREKRLPLRVVTYFDSLPSLPFTSGLGDEWISYGGLKIFIDGSLGGRTAALRAPYSDGEGRGVLVHRDDELMEIVEESARRDIQLMAHVIGDAGIDQLLTVLEKIKSRGLWWSLPPKITHIQVCSPDLVKRAGALGVFCDVQPHQLVSDIHMAPERLGEDRSDWCYPFRSLIDAGAVLVGSSDCPVEPKNPLTGIWGALMRNGYDGIPADGWNSSERLSLSESLAMYTVNPQKLIGRSDFKGTIEPGMVADLAIFDGDLFATDPDKLIQRRVIITMINGEIAYKRQR